MDLIMLIIQFFAAFSSCLVALMSIMLFLQLRWPAPVFWFLKLYASALSPLFALIGLFSTIAGVATGSVLIGLIGIYDF